MAAGTLVVSCSFEDDGKRWNSAHSRRTPLRDATVDALVKAGMSLIRQLATGRPRNRLGVTLVALTAEGFETCSDRGAILKLFQRIPEQSVPPAKRVRSNESQPEDGPPDKSIVWSQKIEKSAGILCGQKYSWTKGLRIELLALLFVLLEFVATRP